MTHQNSKYERQKEKQEKDRQRLEQLKTELSKIKTFRSDGINIELFDQLPNRIAKIVAQSSGDKNKPTQLRRFYDEIVNWYDKLQDNQDNYKQSLPLIKMINAKVAYAKGRKHVDDTFVTLMKHGIGKLEAEHIDTFFNFKLFMEAFMGFYKSYKK